MPRARLGVVLLVPGPVKGEVEGLQRALGSRPRVAPHVTLVPPVNVPVERLAEAVEVVRVAAAGEAPVRLELGPAVTFWPASPVVYLAVGGEPDAVERLHRRTGQGPLDRPADWPFVPHVTLAEDVEPARISAAVGALADYRAEVTVEHVHVLRQGEDLWWRSIASAPLGGGRVVGRGGLPVTLTVSDRPDLDVTAWCEQARAVHLEASYGRLPEAASLLVTARREGTVAGAGWGGVTDELWIDRLVVDARARGQGVGSQVLAELCFEGARRGCARALLVCQRGRPAQSWYEHRGWAVDVELPHWRHGRDFVRLARTLDR
jgi:2'-5' RNA ligase/ribosomal protein S18 acetylase RimI-like enzyme